MKITEFTETKSLEEGRYDPNTFKAIITAGAPGSGKSWFSKKVAETFGLRYINIDDFIEKLAPKYALSLDSYIDDKSMSKFRILKNKLRDLAIGGRLGLLLDGTGRNSISILNTKAKLEELGYDVAMIFVRTDVRTSVERNLTRKRSVDNEFLVKAYMAVRRNITLYSSVFDNFYLLDNSIPKNEEHQQRIKENQDKAWKFIRKFMDQPNPNAKDFEQTGKIDQKVD